jgi:Fe-S-cluster containining protein
MDAELNPPTTNNCRQLSVQPSTCHAFPFRAELEPRYSQRRSALVKLNSSSETALGSTGTPSS